MEQKLTIKQALNFGDLNFLLAKSGMWVDKLQMQSKRY